MQTQNSHLGIRKHKACRLFVLFCVAWTFGVHAVHGTMIGDPWYRSGSGMLVAVKQQNGSIAIIVDDKQYPVSPTVLVVNDMGRPISLMDIKLPVFVFYKYHSQKNDLQKVIPYIAYIEESKISKKK